MRRSPPRSYLLRLWREHAGAPLRATLIAVAPDEAPRHFASLDALHAFLLAEAGAGAPTTHDPDDVHCTPSQPQ